MADAMMMSVGLGSPIEEVKIAEPPIFNLEVEHALLGAILINNDAYFRASELDPAAFFDPIHKQLFEYMGKEIREGRAVDAKMLRLFLVGEDKSATITILEEDPASPHLPPLEKQMPVAEYIQRIAFEAATIINAGDYARTIADLALKRKIDTVADTVKMEARHGMPGEGSRELRARLEVAIETLFATIDDAGIQHISAVLQSSVTRINEAFTKGEVAGLPIGLKGVQDLIGPLVGGRLYIICGAPGSGKSALAAQIAEFIAHDHPVLIDQIEMQAEEQGERLVAAMTGIAADNIERAALDQEEFDRVMEASEKLRTLHLWIDSSTNPTVEKVRMRAMRMKRRHGLAALFIDHLLQMAVPRGMKDHEAVRHNLQGLKRIAKDLGIPVVVLTQPTKEYSSGPIRRPKVSDMYGGSANEQEADVILLLHREEYMLRRAEPLETAVDEHAKWRARLVEVEGKAEAILGKRRGGKGFGTRTLFFGAQRMRFYDNSPREYAMASGSRLFNDS